MEIDGKEYPAYGCETNWWDSEIDWKTGGEYPYEYTPCDAGDAKGDLVAGRCLSDQLLQPKWLCSNYQGTPAYEYGQFVDCKWYLHPGDHAEEGKDPEDVDEFSYPREGEYFLEVIFGDAPNVDMT